MTTVLSDTCFCNNGAAILHTAIINNQLLACFATFYTRGSVSFPFFLTAQSEAHC